MVKLQRIGLWLLLCCLAGSGLAQSKNAREQASEIEMARMAAAVESARQVYNRALMEAFGVALQDKPITIKLANGNDEYASMRVEASGSENSALNAAWSGGVTYPSKRLIILKVSGGHRLERLNRTLWHEMTHVLQGEVKQGAKTGAPQWMAESMANFFSAAVAEQVGLGSLDEHINKTVRTLRKKGRFPDVDKVGKANGTEWKTIAREEGGGYDVANLLAAYVYVAKGPDIIPAMVAYLHCTADKKGHEPCFETHYGMSYDEFLASAGQWIADVVSSGKDVVSAGTRRSAGFAEYQNIQATFHAWMGTHIADTPPPVVKLVLAASPQEMVQQSMRLDDDSEEIERRIALAQQGWAYGDGVATFDVVKLASAYERIRAVVNVSMDAYQSQGKSVDHSLVWLQKGVRQWMADRVAQFMAVQTLEHSVQQRRQILQAAGAKKPALADLMTHAAWDAAVAQYGEAVVLQVAAQATDTLIEQKGWTAARKWLQIQQQQEDAATALVAAWGEDAPALSTRLQSFVR